MIDVETAADWKKLRAAGLLTVLDPLTIRAAEAFIRAAPESEHEPLWEAISKNIGALATFVDALMLHDKLPVFDHGASWDGGIAGASPVVSLVNGDDFEALVEVRVGADAYRKVRQPAIDVLKQLPPVEPALERDIRSELSAFDYTWRPNLEELGPLSEPEQQLASFRYGALLYHYYAESITDRRFRLDRRAEHVLHGKRARIMLAASLAPDGSLSLDEQRLMDTLRGVEQARDGLIASVDVKTPTFLPYLLAKEPRSPAELIRMALIERDRSPVSQYRQWRQGLLADLANGRVRGRTKRDLEAIAREIQRKTNGDPSVSLHVSYVTDWKTLLAALTGNPLGLLAGARVEATADINALTFRIASILPGRGFRKLVSRLVLTQQEYFALDRAIRNLWYHKYT